MWPDLAVNADLVWSAFGSGLLVGLVVAFLDNLGGG